MSGVDTVDTVDTVDDPVIDVSKMADPELEAYLAQPETTKRELYAWYAYDWANSVVFQTVTGSFLGPYLVLIAGNNEASDHKFEMLPGVRVNSATYYSSMTPIAVVSQLLIFMLAGSLGDFGSLRKRLLIFSGLLGAVATSLLVVVDDNTYWLGGLLYVVLQCSIGFSLIQYNAYMPLLVANLPEVRSKRGQPDYDEAETTTAARVSTRGFIFGYVAGLLLLLVNIGISFASPSSCSQWCTECPSAFGNETSGIAGWNAYEYEIQNATMLAEQVYCGTGRKCMAWPGVNPPCGNGSATDIVEGQCVNFDAWQRYTYSTVGVRWSMSTLAPLNATEVSFRTRDICTVEKGADNRTATNSTMPVLTFDNAPFVNATNGLWRGLVAKGGVADGCPHFRCSRNDCSRGFDPTTCDPTHIGTRVNLMTAGLWWGGFGCLTYFGLKARPGPPFPRDRNVVLQGLKRTWTTLKKVRKLRNTFIFLLAFFFYADGFSTIGFGAAIVATRAPLFFSTLQLGLLLLETNITALLGNFFYEWLSKVLVHRWRIKRIAAGDKEEDLDR
jgi:MFS-type transporter involved in bile tolerance (Atg22 family)